jgi:hypothetical protein
VVSELLLPGVESKVANGVRLNMILILTPTKRQITVPEGEAHVLNSFMGR